MNSKLFWVIFVVFVIAAVYLYKKSQSPFGSAPGSPLYSTQPNAFALSFDKTVNGKEFIIEKSSNYTLTIDKEGNRTIPSISLSNNSTPVYTVIVDKNTLNYFNPNNVFESSPLTPLSVNTIYVQYKNNVSLYVRIATVGSIENFKNSTVSIRPGVSAFIGSDGKVTEQTDAKSPSPQTPQISDSTKQSEFFPLFFKNTIAVYSLQANNNYRLTTDPEGKNEVPLATGNFTNGAYAIFQMDKQIYSGKVQQNPTNPIDFNNKIAATVPCLYIQYIKPFDLTIGVYPKIVTGGVTLIDYSNNSGQGKKVTILSKNFIKNNAATLDSSTLKVDTYTNIKKTLV